MGCWVLLEQGQLTCWAIYCLGEGHIILTQADGACLNLHMIVRSMALLAAVQRKFNAAWYCELAIWTTFFHYPNIPSIDVVFIMVLIDIRRRRDQLSEPPIEGPSRRACHPEGLCTRN